MRRCSLAELERDYILLALEVAEGKKKEAAELFGIDRKTLYRKVHDGAHRYGPVLPLPRELFDFFPVAVTGIKSRRVRSIA